MAINSINRLSQQSLKVSEAARSNPDITSFQEAQVGLLQRRLEEHQQKLQELYANAYFHEVEYSRLLDLTVDMSVTARQDKLICLLNWFTHHYQPARLRLFIQASKLQRISHSKLHYCPQAHFGRTSLSQLIDFDTICFAAIDEDHSKWLFKTQEYRSIGTIPFGISTHYLADRGIQRGTQASKQSRRLRAWLVFADTGNRFLPDSSLSNTYLVSLQGVLNRLFQ